MTGDQSPRLQNYLEHILEAIRRIDGYVAELGEAGFMADPKTQDAVIRNLEIIGEACRNIDKRYPDFAESHPEVPWTVAYEMRNALAHGYFQVDLEIVWRTVERDLPELEHRIQVIRKP